MVSLIDALSQLYYYTIGGKMAGAAGCRLEELFYLQWDSQGVEESMLDEGKSLQIAETMNKTQKHNSDKLALPPHYWCNH